MILDEITLDNFGLYAGNQTVVLTPPSRDKPIILFGGLNGGGKTTLIDALQLCLFGPHAKTSSRGSGAYREYLSKCIYRGATKQEAAIKISFRHMVEGNEDQYSLRRSWHRANGSCKEHLEVLKNGRSEPTLAKNWSSHVEDFLPANIAHLFLFDGEQIEAYASGEESSSLIGAGIQSLLGLDMVDQLEKDLRVYERRKRTEAKNHVVRLEIAAEEADLRELRSRVDALKQDRAALQTHQIDRKKKALVVIEQKYRKLGGDLFDQKTEIERRLSAAESLVDDGTVGLLDLASGPLPLLLMRGLMESAHSRDCQEEEGRRARELSEAIESRDQALLNHLRAESVGTNAVEALKIYLEHDREHRTALGKQTALLDLLPSVRSELHGFLQGGFDDLAALSAQQLEKQTNAALQAADARIEYESVPTSDIIADTVAEREAARSEIVALELQYAGMGQEIDRLEREIGRREQSLVQLLRADADDRSSRDDRARILRHAEKVRTTLDTFRRAVIERHVRRIEQLVLESYKRLLRKTSLVTRLSIDPANFSLTLFGRDGEVLNADRLSAGERQLLAVALLWGLAKASGRPLPTAIDTPLGRLDTGHRMHLVERYFPFASHQMLLLSTDEEITGEYLERLRPWIGRTYRLAYDDQIGRTHVVPGYFDAREGS